MFIVTKSEQTWEDWTMLHSEILALWLDFSRETELESRGLEKLLLKAMNGELLVTVSRNHPLNEPLCGMLTEHLDLWEEVGPKRSVQYIPRNLSEFQGEAATFIYRWRCKYYLCSEGICRLHLRNVTNIKHTDPLKGSQAKYSGIPVWFLDRMAECLARDSWGRGSRRQVWMLLEVSEFIDFMSSNLKDQKRRKI